LFTGGAGELAIGTKADCIWCVCNTDSLATTRTLTISVVPAWSTLGTAKRTATTAIDVGLITIQFTVIAVLSLTITPDARPGWTIVIRFASTP
jgi:hypothetical protein